MPLKGMSISGTSAKTQDRRNGYQEVGVSHSSDEASNDRGAQIERERETMTVHSNDGLSWLTKLERIGEKSAANEHEMFSNLGHLVNVDMLKGQFLRLDGNKATGIDGMTKAVYGERLDEYITVPIVRIRRGTYHPQAAESRRYQKRTAVNGR